MAVSKKQREIIFNKFGKRCAYCGDPLQKGWHVDEIEPVRRKHKIIHSHYIHKSTGEVANTHHLSENAFSEQNFQFVPEKTVADGYTHPERLHIDNQNPSCASCNINKHSDSLETFRRRISGFIVSLNRDSVQYKVAKRYGLIKEKIKPIVFYFETLNKK